MLWEIKKEKVSGLYWLDEVHKCFYQKMFNGFKFADCFPSEFLNVLLYSNRTREYFKDVYSSYYNCTMGDQVLFVGIFQQQVNFSSLFVKKSISLILTKGLLSSELWKASQKLGAYLYTTTIDLKCYRDSVAEMFGLPIVISTMQEHFNAFQEENGKVCCFCGLEEMVTEVLIEPEDGILFEEENQRRACYDHFLPKSYFPFLAVDFNNLAPCCDVCNEEFKKGKNPLFHQEERTLAFPLYGSDFAKVDVTYENENGDFYRIRVGIEKTGCHLEQKGLTWRRIFRSIERANAQLENDFKEDWAAPLLCDVENVSQARRKLTVFAKKNFDARKVRKTSYYKALCFSYLHNLNDAELLPLIKTVSDSYSKRLGEI